MTGTGTASPWAAALGSAVGDLHPRIRDYVGAIPAGSVGRGQNVFEVVGTPRRWLWPVLAVLARQSVLAVLARQSVLVPVWRRRVPFRVVNRRVDGRLTAERTLTLPGGSWTMRDAVSMQGGTLVDDLGASGRYRARLVARAEGGALRLRSTGVSVRVGRMHMPLPRLLAPTVVLREGWDDAAGRQRVDLRLEYPLLGRLYEYSGTFTYRIEEERA